MLRSIRLGLGLAAGLLVATSAWAQDVKLRLAYVPVVGAAPVFVFHGAGWAKAEGLDIGLVRFDSGPPAINALASGTIDVLAIGIAPVAVARAKGLDVKVVAAVATGGSGFVASQPLAAAFEAAGNDVAKAFAAFREANRRPVKIATLPPGGVPTVALNHWLFKLNNVARADVQISGMGIDAVQQAVLSGAVDGGTVLEPARTIVLDRDPKLRALLTATQMFDAIPGVVIAVSGPFAKAHPEAVDKLVALSIRGAKFIGTNTDEAAALVQPILGGGLVDQTVLARSLKSDALTYVADPKLIAEATDRLLAYQVELGDFQTAPPTDGLFDFGPYEHVTSK
jgi:NitT/TauT family transport system substrate-binding protein